MRVDSQVDDKDVRKKCRHMKTYTTADFEIDPKFQLIPRTNKSQKIKKNVKSFSSNLMPEIKEVDEDYEDSQVR